jgi:nucleoside 2-deoxyribosyltransferase
MTESKTESKKAYFAGALFNAKELLGNMLIGKSIDQCSQGRYECVLPQNLEVADARSVAIRNVDLLNVMLADVCIFKFDGSELDSGTVVEFMFAKMLDIPCAILRTDFRSSGDQKEGDPWNLMCSFYPRTETVLINGMSAYHGNVHGKATMFHGITDMCTHIAEQVVVALDKAAAARPIYTALEAKAVYKAARRFPGSGYSDLISLQNMSGLIADKQSRGLLIPNPVQK